MKKGHGALKAIVGELARSSERSPLFWWMVEHHDTLVDAAAGRRIRWKPLCVKFATLGLTDGTGKPATEKTAGETWLRARTEVARQRKDRAKAEAALFPTLRPVPQAKWNPAPPPIATPAATHSRQPPADETDEARAKRVIAELRAGLRERSR
jgi:hypothetical protein